MLPIAEVGPLDRVLDGTPAARHGAFRSQSARLLTPRSASSAAATRGGRRIFCALLTPGGAQPLESVVSEQGRCAQCPLATMAQAAPMSGGRRWVVCWSSF
jgi:hypothetical protein